MIVTNQKILGEQFSIVMNNSRTIILARIIEQRPLLPWSKTPSTWRVVFPFPLVHKTDFKSSYDSFDASIEAVKTFYMFFMEDLFRSMEAINIE